jgi:EmrB/QacA subfamily drug resistance transporter
MTSQHPAGHAQQSPAPIAPVPPTTPRAGLALLVVATAQLMLVLDDTIANIALPSIQRDLGVATTMLPCIVSAYVLTFGALLLFGGRLGDLYGRRRVLRAGLGVFIVASLVGGLAPSGELLVAARALQGIGAALIAPNVLALIATNFAPGKARNNALGVYAAMSAVGMTVGMLLGGLLTGLLDWRWVFFINIPIGLAVLAGTTTLLEGQRSPGRLQPLDATTGAAAVLALAYGITRGGEHGWTNISTLLTLLAAATLGAVFVWLQTRRTHPMFPLALLRDRNRAGAYVTVVFVGLGFMGTYFLLSLYMQQVLGYGPIRSGLATLPVAVGIVISAGVSSKLVERFPVRAVSVPGLVTAAVGLVWFSTLTVDSTYATHILPALFLTYFGLGMGFIPMTLAAVHGVPEEQSGVASALLNTAQQLGAALGIAVLSTISATTAGSRLPDDGATLRTALTDGYTTAYLWAGGLLLVAALIAAVAVTSSERHHDAKPAA